MRFHLNSIIPKANTMKKYFIFPLFFFLLSCAEKEIQNSVVEPTGTMLVKSDKEFDEAYSALLESLERNRDVTVVSELDLNSSSNSEEGRKSKLVFFANPVMGTPLLQRNQLAGLDLPQHILLFEDEGDLYAMYNSMKYLKSRFNLKKEKGLEKISRALENFTNAAMGTRTTESGVQEVTAEQGIITVESEQDFEQTHSLILESLKNADYEILAEVDHSRNAAEAGMNLRPTKLILFELPGQKEFLENNPTAGLDFPMKMLVWEGEDGIVKISYNDPDYLQERHQLEETNEKISKTESALENITKTSAKAKIPVEDSKI